MQKSLVLFSSLIVLLFLLTGCGPQVEVPPGHVGKVSSPDGLQKGIIDPSKFRLDFQFPGTIGNSLILAEAYDLPAKERMDVFMPKDQLNLTVDVRGTFTINPNERNINKIFDKLSAKSVEDRVSKITMVQTYKTYAEPVIREVIRSYLTRYSIQEVMQNRERIGVELQKEVYEKLDNTPIKPIYFGLANIQPPPIILKAQEKAKEREIAIREAENEKMVSLKKAEAAYEVAVKQQQVDLKEAETQVLVNKKLAEGVNEAFVIQRSLKILDQMARSKNKVFFLPQEAFSNPGMLLGAFKSEDIRGVK
jgi:hypothetical protein